MLTRETENGRSSYILLCLPASRFTSLLEKIIAVPLLSSPSTCESCVYMVHFVSYRCDDGPLRASGGHETMQFHAGRERTPHQMQYQHTDHPQYACRTRWRSSQEGRAYTSPTIRTDDASTRCCVDLRFDQLRALDAFKGGTGVKQRSASNNKRLARRGKRHTQMYDCCLL